MERINENNNLNNTNINYSYNIKTLIPITTSICQKLNYVNQVLNFCGINVNEVLIIGNLMSIFKDESKITFKICDMTSTIDVIFFLRYIDESLDEMITFGENK
jgi:hypothetical protein